MEQDSVSTEQVAENSGRPTRESPGGTEASVRDRDAPQNDLESASAPNEDWGLETLPKDDKR